jgi:hypothetical protein
MRGKLYAVRARLAILLFWRWQFWHSKTGRYVMYSVAANIVGYSLVLILTSKGVGKWWANESVSKGMAPAGLMLNTLALTGRFRPSSGQATKWILYWLPSALVGSLCMALVVTKFGLDSLQSRAVAGMMMFPFDYTVKRFIVFARQARLANFLFKQKFTLVVLGVLIWREFSLPTNCPGIPRIKTA